MQLRVNVLKMRLHGLRADVKTATDFIVVEALAQRVEERRRSRLESAPISALTRPQCRQASLRGLDLRCGSQLFERPPASQHVGCEAASSAGSARSVHTSVSKQLVVDHDICELSSRLSRLRDHPLQREYRFRCGAKYSRGHIASEGARSCHRLLRAECRRRMLRRMHVPRELRRRDPTDHCPMERRPTISIATRGSPRERAMQPRVISRLIRMKEVIRRIDVLRFVNERTRRRVQTKSEFCRCQV